MVFHGLREIVLKKKGGKGKGKREEEEEEGGVCVRCHRQYFPSTVSRYDIFPPPFFIF